jgi:hypothetical protein
MRKLTVALAIGLLAATSAFAITTKPVKAAAIATKVVIVVGATHGETESYISHGRQLASIAREYTSNVIEVYSPNATWSAVKAAAAGANILVYLGHGNGEPSPYHPNMWPNTTDMQAVDGMGLNLTAGHGHSNTHYYGETYAMTLDLAPHALVMLNHLCYAAGNSEPQDPAPTLAVARQRIDNFGAGFIRAGAEAVIAEGHSGLGGYMRAFFESHTSVETMWKKWEWSHGNFSSWQSSRNPTYTSQMDPDSPSGGYYRSMVSKPGLKTDEVISGTESSFASKTGTFVPLPPTRVIDTRGNGIGPYGFLMANGVYEYQIAGLGGVPTNAVAITGNVTVTQASRNGYVYLGPRIWTRPGSSTINFRAGDDRANGVTVPLAEDGTIQAYHDGGTGRTVQMILDVTGYFLPNTDGKGFVPFGPTRIQDTRPGPEQKGLAGPFVARVSRQVQVAGVEGLPEAGSIQAVVGNVTVVNPTARGYVYLSPTPVPDGQEPPSSTINFPAWDIRANNFVVPINPDGTIWVIYWVNTGAPTVDVVIDISGYFATSGGAQYHTLNPARIMDSRYNIGVAGPFSARLAGTLQVSGQGGVPNDATAITANLTVTGQTALGFGAIGPTIDPSTPFSNINFPTGDNRANGVTVPLKSGGTVEIVYGATPGQATHFVLDVCGYYVAP